MRKKLPIRFLARYLGNVLRSRLGRADRRKLARPMVASLYLTVKCNFRCTYCDDGTGVMYPDLPEPDRLDTERTLAVIDILRRASPGLNLTGGEPLLRPDIDEVVRHAGRAGFDVVTLNTNAFLLDRHLELLGDIDFLVVSLDAVRPDRSDAVIDLARGGQTARVLANLALAGEERRRRGGSFDVIVNTVVMPETIDDAWDVFEHCIEHDLLFSPMPHVIGVYPNPGLVDEPRWHDLIDEVIRARRAGIRVLGNELSLRAIRSFERFECYPGTRPIVHPNGDLFYPCGPLEKKAGNLLEIGDYGRALEQGFERHGPVPHCDARCHLSCYMETSTLIEQPGEALREVFRWLAPRKRGHFALRRPPRRGSRPEPLAACSLRSLPSLPPDEVRARASVAGVTRVGRPEPLVV